MREVKVAFSEPDLERLTKQAEAQGVSRAGLIRQRVFSAEERLMHPKDIHQLVQKVRRRAGFVWTAARLSTSSCVWLMKFLIKKLWQLFLGVSGHTPVGGLPA